MYDKYGFIVNKHKITGEEIDQGDSCYHMGLQALIYCLNKTYKKAYDLYLKCLDIDFYRHPIFYKKDTSFDMLVIWDLLYYFFPQAGFNRPPLHSRKSKFWNGRLANRDILYHPLKVLGESTYLRLIPSVGDDFFKNTLCLLSMAISYSRTGNKKILEEMQVFVKFLEGKTTIKPGEVIPNIFYYWLVSENKPTKITPKDCQKWLQTWYPSFSASLNVDPVDMWEFSRNPQLYEFYKNRSKYTEFHKENGKSLSQQFVDYFLQTIK